jgi:hypothetical protein
MADQAQEVATDGRCLCSAVTIAVKGKPVRMAQCHCRDCQRASSTGHLSNAIFEGPDVTVSGDTNSFTVITDSGSRYTRHFCPRCGSLMFGTNTRRPGMFIVPVGILDDSSWFAPQLVLFTRSRPAWDITTDEVTNYATSPPLPPLPADEG